MPYPEGITALLEEHHLAVARVFRTEPNFTAAVIQQDGSPAVLKVGDPHHLAAQIEALRHWNGRGMARLLWSDEVNGVLLLEHITPGHELTALVPENDDEATEIIANLVNSWPRIIRTSDSQIPMVHDWLRGIEKFHAQILRQEVPGDAKRVQRALDLGQELTADLKTLTLVHADLHHENVLKCDVRGWIAIDPIGVWGNSVMEFYALLRNPNEWVEQFPTLRPVLNRRLDVLSANLCWERELIRDWAFVMVTISQGWFVEDLPPGGLPAMFYKDGEIAEELLSL